MANRHLLWMTGVTGISLTGGDPADYITCNPKIGVRAMTSTSKKARARAKVAVYRQRMRANEDQDFIDAVSIPGEG